MNEDKGKNGVCKWRRVKEGDPWYYTYEWLINCGEEPPYREEPNDGWEFCPYCGERIEVEWR